VSFFQFVNHWWNLPFLVMLGLVAAFFVLQLVGLVGHDSEADLDHDIDHDVDVDHDADVDADADAGSGWQGALSFFGVGRVPFMVVWGPLFIFGGFAGIFFNRVWFVRLGGHYPGWLFALSLLFALVVGLFFTRAAVRLASKLVDTGGRGSARKHELVGALGVVASAHVDDGFGEIRVHDRAKNEMLVHARIRPGERRLQRGEAVVLIDYEERRELFLVEPSDLEGKTGVAS
jgi:membrane protein implicated in regulation of membrane protease activity